MSNNFRYTHGYDYDRHRGRRIGTLWCSNVDIDGDVTLQLGFDQFDVIERIDLLNDVIGILERERDHQMELSRRQYEMTFVQNDA